MAKIASERLNVGLPAPSAAMAAPGLLPSGEEEIAKGWGATPPATPGTPTHASSPGVSRRKASMSRSDSAVSLRIRELERRTSSGSAPGSPSTPRAATGSTAVAPDAGPTGVITAADVFSMAKQGDEVAVRVVEETCDYLGLACVNICRMLDPDAILLTGGLSKAEGLVDKVRRRPAGGGGVRCWCSFVDRRPNNFISVWRYICRASDTLHACVVVQTVVCEEPHGPSAVVVVAHPKVSA